MVTDPEEFRQRLLDIQNSVNVEYTRLPLNEPHFIINANTRTITIPSEFGFIGVKNDHKAENIYFEIDRYFDYEDLSNHTCIVQYSYKGFEGIYPVTSLDVESIDGKILFCWTIMNDATRDFGDINFSVRFYSIENDEYTYNFNTLTASSKILDTLDVNHYPYASPTPEQFQIYIDKTNEISDKMDNFTTTVTESENKAKEYANDSMRYRDETRDISVEEIEKIQQAAETKEQEVITNIETKEQEVLASIPEDYTNLNNDVAELNGYLSHLDNTVFDKKKSEYVVTTTPEISYQFKKGMKYSIHISTSGTTQLQVGTIDTSYNYIDSTSVITDANVDTDFDFIASNDSNVLYVYRIPNSTSASITINDFSDYRFATKDEIKEPIKDYSKIIQNSFKVESDIWGIVNGTVSDNGLEMTSGGSAFHRMPVAFDDFVMSATFKITSADAVVGLAMEGWKSKITLEASNNRVVIYNNPTNTTDLSEAETVMLSDTIELNKWYKLVLKRDGWDYNITVIELNNMTEILNHSYSNFKDTNTRNYCRFTGYFGIVCDSGTSLCGDFYVSINHKNCKCLIIGDSLTEGDQVTNSDRWAYRLKNEYFKGNAIVAGCGGDSTNPIKTRLEKYIALGIDFDICIVLCGMNDRDGSNQDTFKSNMSDIVDLILSKNAIPIIAVNPIPSSGADDIHTQRAYVVSKGWNTIRFDYAFSPSYAHNAALFNSDGIHPNENGNAVMYETACNVLDKLLIN